MKVKIITSSIYDEHTVEEQINAFIADKNVIDIKYQMCVYGATFSMTIKSALIMYEEKENG